MIYRRRENMLSYFREMPNETPMFPFSAPLAALSGRLYVHITPHHHHHHRSSSGMHTRSKNGSRSPLTSAFSHMGTKKSGTKRDVHIAQPDTGPDSPERYIYTYH
jgi:hypothetical protein